MSFQKARNITRPSTARVKLCEDTGRCVFLLHIALFLALTVIIFNGVSALNAKRKSLIHLLPTQPDSLSDSLLLWLSGELSKEDTALLVLALRLRRSAAQLLKTRAGSSLSSQAFSILVTWRRGLPAVPSQPKASLLARCLAKIGRPDLAGEVLLRQAAATRQSSKN